MKTIQFKDMSHGDLKLAVSLFAFITFIIPITLIIMESSGCKKPDYTCQNIIMLNDSIERIVDAPDQSGTPLCNGTLVSSDTTPLGIRKTYLYCKSNN